MAEPLAQPLNGSLRRSKTSEKLKRAASTTGMLAHQVAKPLGVVSTVGLSVFGASAFGTSMEGQNRAGEEQMEGREMSGLTGLMILGGEIGIPILAFVIFLEMKWYKNESGDTWFQRYGNTPGVTLFQLSTTFSLWIFAFHLFKLYTEKFHGQEPGCSMMCEPYRYWPNTSIEAMYKITFNIHIYAAGFIAVLGPLQFWEKGGATGMIIYQILYSDFPKALIPQEYGRIPYIFYASSFPFYNIYAWVAIIAGWKAAVARDIPLHGGMMHRLGAMWFAIVIAFRILPLYIGTALAALDMNPYWTLGISAHIVFWLCAGATEVYIRKAGRFVYPKTHVREGAMCPFLASQSLS